MERKFVYPVDTDQFERIRETGRYYVDKTDMVHDLVQHYDYIFLARPRRFGKTLLCTTLKAYFEGRKDLFDGLKIMALEKEWKTYPVLHFNISDLKNLSVAQAREKLGMFIARYEEIYGRAADETTPGARFCGLIHRAHQKTGERVVVLIDEYDAPIMRMLHDRSQRDEMRTLLREFYQTVKSEGEHLRFTFFTGVTKFSQLTIFSELNNLFRISMLDEYSGLCGITQRELDGPMRPCVEDFAERNAITTEEAYAILKRHYDGYHFSRNSEDVYSPFSLLRALQTGVISNYWFEAATMTSLLENLSHYPALNPLELDGKELDALDFDVACEDADTSIPLLYQSGYLSIKHYDRNYDTYTLGFPNEEVRQSLIKGLMPTILRRQSTDTKALVNHMTRALFDGDLSKALLLLRAYIAGIPYDIITKEEWDDKARREAFYKLLIYMVFSLLNSLVDTEVKSILGRADVVVQTRDDIFVLELKVDDTADNALRQIDDKSYAAHYEADGRRITKCGVCIDSTQRNITAWKSTDAEGHLVDERTF